MRTATICGMGTRSPGPADPPACYQRLRRLANGDRPVPMNHCPSCGHALTLGGAFCQHCGAALAGGQIACPACATLNPPGTNFCFACGARVAGPRAPAVEGRLVAVKRDGTDGQSFRLVGEQIDLGRTEGDLLFDDPHLAPRHARLHNRNGQFVLTPLDNLNGVYVRIYDATELADNDLILVGKQVMKFELVPDVEKTIRPAVEHGIVLFGTPVKAPWGRLRQITAAGIGRDVYHLVRSEITLGREQGDLLFPDDEFMSRRHSQLRVKDGRVSLADLGSSNGTFLRIRASHPLQPGETIRMGDELLRFEIG